MNQPALRLCIAIGTAMLCGLLWAANAVAPAATPATVAKPGVQARAKPDFAAPTVAALAQNSSVSVTGQQGLWFKLALAGGKAGFVRVNDIRVTYGSKETGGLASALFSGKAGKGRVTETASVRGLDESKLQTARFDAEQLQLLESYRATPEQADAAAAKRGWTTTEVPFAEEFKPKQDGKPQPSQAQKRARLGMASGVLSMFNPMLGRTAGSGDKLMGKSEAEISEEEQTLGPLIAGRVLGAVPLLKDPAAQKRVNLIGRWLASRTSRPELPWTFGVIDDGELNAFAAPGGYVLITRGLYQLLASDAEVAAVLGHELSHVVQRDHYEVVRKQELQAAGRDAALSHVQTGGGVAGGMVRDYLEKNGAAILLTQLDRNAEYRADHAAGIYLARAGCNPLELYAVLQKMAALGSASPRLASLYKTHPPLDKRLDALDKRGYDDLSAWLSR